MLEGFEPTEPTAAVYHVIYDDGSAGRIEVTSGVVPELTRPGTFVTEERYLELASALEEKSAALVAELEAAQQGRSLADYLALIAVGLAEETARRMSGYAGLDVNPLAAGEG